MPVMKVGTRSSFYAGCVVAYRDKNAFDLGTQHINTPLINAHSHTHTNIYTPLINMHTHTHPFAVSDRRFSL